MLSKKFSDMIFISVVILIIAAIFVMRVIILNTYDDRIERYENEITELEAQIARDARLIVDNRHDQLPSLEEMAQVVPRRFDFNALEDLIYGMVAVSNIPLYDADADVFVGIGSAPAAYGSPTGNAFNPLTQHFDLYRVTISFNTDDLDDMRVLLDHLDSVNQLFVIQSLEFYLNTDNPLDFSVEVVLVTFYQK